MPDLVDLDLSRLDMRGDLFDLQSSWESSQLVENNSEVGAWHLLHRLVAHHVEFLIEVVAHAEWAVWIPIGLSNGFFVPVMLAIDILRQASITLISGFAILRDTVVEELTPEP